MANQLQGPAGFGSSFASLPDALLERILGQLETPDRHCAALVSHRWHAAAHAPEALRRISAHPSLAQLQPLTAWLLHHGQHVHSLELRFFSASSEAEQYVQQLAACLEALAAAGSLQQLTLSFEGHGSGLCITSWCAALQQLRSLDLSMTAAPLRISHSLVSLSGITRLALEGRAVNVDSTAQLPPNVERLRLWDGSSRELPGQLSRLTRLSMLKLYAHHCEPDGYAVLTSLGLLSQLSLDSNRHLPGCLPQLTTLRELHMDEACLAWELDEIQEALDAALLHLTQLTSLCIDDELDRCRAPAALAGLSRLQRCCLGSPFSGEVSPTPLPLGPWAASLRSLGATLDVLQHSAEMLSAATQLSRLAIMGSSFQGEHFLTGHSVQFWGWVRSHPSLQQLQIDMLESADISADTLHAVCSLARERPQLEVSTIVVRDSDADGKRPTLWDEFQFDIKSVR